MEGTLLSPAPPSQGAYLPAFLMGEMPSIMNMSSSKPYMLATSPTKMPYSSPWKYSHTQAASDSFANQAPRSEHKNRMREKPGAPPVQGLIESMASPATRSVWQTSNDTPRAMPSTPSYQAPMSSPMKVSPMHQSPPATAPSSLFQTPRQSTAFGLDQQGGADDCCVTVFGFQPSAASFILQQFSQFGTVLDHQIASAGNWMHLRYQSPRQASLALSRNGRLFGNVMVGVGPCTDRSFIDKQPTSQQYAQQPETPRDDSPWLSRVQQADRSAVANSSMFAGGTSLYASPRSSVYDVPRSGAGVKRSASMRPLATNYRGSQTNSPMLNTDGATPAKRGFMGKAMNYIFGL